MAKLKIYTFPDDVLAKRAKPIDRVEKGLYRLADDMLETMYFAPGVGLAANQVGILDRIVVVDTEYDWNELPEGVDPPQGVEVVDGGLITNKKPQILINPEIIYREGTTAIKEGCLSVPEFQAEIPRAEKIKVKFQDIDGVQRELSAEGLLAVCIQHELDHLDGKLFIDHLSPMKKDIVKKKLKAERKQRGE